MSKAVALLRVSTDRQAASGNGLEAQRSAIHDYCEKEGLELKASFIEEGVSGATPLEKREELLKALAALDRGDTLVVMKYDRLSRVLLEQLTIERMVSRKGCRIVATSNQAAAGDDPANQLLRNLLASVAEFERQLIKQRTKESVEARQVLGLAVSKPPYGFKIGEGKRLEPNPSELEVIGVMKTIRDQPAGRFGDRKTPWRAVADHLNTNNLLKRNGKVWTEHNVWKTYRAHQRYSHLLEEK